MARPGPAPKPTALKRLQGNPGKRKLNDREPIPQSGNPWPPHWLPQYAKTEWRYIVKYLDGLGILSKVDRGVLVNYCLAYADLREATEMLEREDTRKVYRTSGGNYSRNPWQINKEKAAERLNRYSCELGVTPSARSRIKVDTTPEESLGDTLAAAAFDLVAK